MLVLNAMLNLGWLNDSIMNVYLELIQERSSGDDYPSVHSLSTFFYPRLMESGYSAVKRWTKHVNIFDCDFVCIPVHLGKHWCMAIVDFKQKRVLYLDSRGGDNPPALGAIRKYLEDESMDKKECAFDLSDWRFESPKDIPQQRNDCDCGVFALKFADYLTRRKAITFSQEHIPYFRKRMVHEILSKTLIS